MALPSDFAQHVKSAADIARIIGETVTLKKSGSNYIGLCPFHQEKTPSFSVHSARQFPEARSILPRSAGSERLGDSPGSRRICRPLPQPLDVPYCGGERQDDR